MSFCTSYKVLTRWHQNVNVNLTVTDGCTATWQRLPHIYTRLPAIQYLCDSHLSDTWQFHLRRHHNISCFCLYTFQGVILSACGQTGLTASLFVYESRCNPYSFLIAKPIHTCWALHIQTIVARTREKSEVKVTLYNADIFPQGCGVRY